MSLTDDINNLPASPQEVMPGHLDHHATIHSALKNHNSRLTDIDDELDAVSVHNHVSGDITDAVTSVANIPYRVLKTNSRGSFTIHTHSITELGDPTNKSYVDSADTGLSNRIDGKADSVHRHVSSDITDAVTSIANTPNRVLKTNSTGKLSIHTNSITDQGDPTNKAYVDAADTTMMQRIDLLFPESIRTGQVLKWDGAKFIPSWMDQHANLYDDKY